MSETQQEDWKERWTYKGLPETLLDAMILEANAEYETEIGVWKFNNYAIVKVIVDGDTIVGNDFYVYVVQRANKIFMGEASQISSWIFPQVPCTEIFFSVYKLNSDSGVVIKKFGYTVETVTKNMDVHVTLDSYLPTENNLWINGTFEETPPDMHPWQEYVTGAPTGEISASNEEARTGIYSMKFHGMGIGVYYYVVPYVLEKSITQFDFWGKSPDGATLNFNLVFDDDSVISLSPVFGAETGEYWEYFDLKPYLDLSESNTKKLVYIYIEHASGNDCYVDDFILRTS
jgi:hypothetical protein